MASQLRFRLAFGLAVALLLVASMEYVAQAAPGDIFNLGTVGGSYSSAWAISDTAQASGSSYPIGDNQQRAFRYSGTPGAGGTMVDIGTLGGTEAAGYAINDAGQVAGESSTTGNVVAHAFRYTGTPGAGGVIADLGALGGTRSAAYGINNSGQVVGQLGSTYREITLAVFKRSNLNCRVRLDQNAPFAFAWG